MIWSAFKWTLAGAGIAALAAFFGWEWVALVAALALLGTGRKATR